MTALALRNLLEAGDVEGCAAYWRKHAPQMPQAESRDQTEIVMHLARTASESVTLDRRAWSHRWLLDRGLPSQLPDGLKPKAERLYPERRVAVGISINFNSPWMKGAERLVQSAMEEAVLEADAHGKIEDAAFVSARMAEAKAKAMKSLFGSID